MMNTKKEVNISLLVPLFIIALSLLLPGTSQAQGFGGYGGFGGGGGYGGMGYGGMGYGGAGFGGMGGPGAGPGQVLVKYGEKIYDAVYGDLVDYKVYYLNMTADTIGVHYFDDGTHGDEVPYDGIPSNITINRDTYLGPFSIKYKSQLEYALEMMESMGALSFYDLNVATESPDSRVASLDSARTQMGDVLEGLRTKLAQFEGYNDDRYQKAIDPSLFESMEGFGAGGFGAGGILPDLPPPPGMPEPSVRGPEMPEEGVIDAGDGAAPEAPASNPITRPINQAEQAVGALELQNSLSP
jgi:hypothetical protein